MNKEILDDEEILKRAADFSEESIKKFKKLDPKEPPFGTEYDIKSRTGTVSRMELKWVAIALRYFPNALFEIMKGRIGKETAERIEYDYGRLAGMDIHARFRALGMGNVESMMAVMQMASYTGWGIPYMQHAEGIFSTIVSAFEGLSKKNRQHPSMKEFVDTFKSDMERLNAKVEMISDKKAGVITKMYWINSFVAESYLTKNKRYKEPVCMFLSGITHGTMEGFSSALAEEIEERSNVKLPFGLSVAHIKEISCKVQGKRFCTFEYALEIVKK